MTQAPKLARLELRPPPGPVDLRVRPPGSKSLSNRALLLAAMAQGPSELQGLLDADDTRHMIESLRACGVDIHAELDATPPRCRVEGLGASFGVAAATAPVYVGTAGTVARFLLAALAARGTPAQLDGSPRMRERPMATLIDALRERGARIRCQAEAGALPLSVEGPVHYRGGELRMARPSSSQFISALAIAAVWADTPTRIVLEQGSPAMPYITMTLDAMRDFGFEATWTEPGRSLEVHPGIGRGRSYAVEPDASAASYFLALAAITGGRAEIPALGSRSQQGDARFFEVLERFGARGEQDETRTIVEGSGQLRGLELDLSDMPDMTLTAAVVAAHARGTTRIRGVSVLRHHESDRIAAGAAELRKLGCAVEEHPDGLDIVPPASGSLRSGVEIETYDDHRMAMAFALAGEVVILDPGCAAKTFPRYFEELAELGMCSPPSPEASAD